MYKSLSYASKLNKINRIFCKTSFSITVTRGVKLEYFNFQIVKEYQYADKGIVTMKKTPHRFLIMPTKVENT